MFGRIDGGEEAGEGVDDGLSGIGIGEADIST